MEQPSSSTTPGINVVHIQQMETPEVSVVTRSMQKNSDTPGQKTARQLDLEEQARIRQEVTKEVQEARKMQEAQGQKASIPTWQPKSVTDGCPTTTAQETRRADIALGKTKVHEEEDQTFEHADNKRTKKSHFSVKTMAAEDKMPWKMIPTASESSKNMFRPDYWFKPSLYTSENVVKIPQDGPGANGNTTDQVKSGAGESKKTVDLLGAEGKKLPIKDGGSTKTSEKVCDSLKPLPGMQGESRNSSDASTSRNAKAPEYDLWEDLIQLKLSITVDQLLTLVPNYRQ